MEAEGSKTGNDGVGDVPWALVERAANIGGWDWDIETGSLHWSDCIEPMFGLTRGQFGETHEAFLECIHPDDRQYVVDSIDACVEGGDDYAVEYRIVWPNGTVRWVSETGDVVLDESGKAVRMLGVVQDITNYKTRQEHEQLAGQILRCLNREGTGADLVREVLKLVKNATGFDAVAIRQRDGDDFPYLEVNGLGEDFIAAENFLCCRDEAGESLYDSQGRPVMECMCGNVLCDRVDATLPFFTEAGSFWTNSTTELLACSHPEALQVPTRNECNRAGYESVALIPLRSGDEIVGLLQLNDTRRGRFTVEMISFLEEIGTSIGIGMARARAEREVESLAKFPSENPNPILRVATGGRLLYANDACESLVAEWDCALGQLVPDDWRRTISEVYSSGTDRKIEAEVKGRTFSFVIVPVVSADYVNLYVRDITERKRDEEEIESLAKFPSENPNPVLRIARNSMVLYVNAAGSELLANWGCKVGEPVPGHWRQDIVRILESGSSEALEAVCGDRIFSLIIAPVADADYVNVYGIDITERKHAEKDIRDYRDHLEELVQIRTAELTYANEKLLQEIEGRKRLEKEILNISEREQRRIGRELHDSIGQQFTGIAFMMKALEQKLADKLPDEATDVAEIKKLVNQALDQTRGLAKGLHPIDLDAGSLTEALGELAATTEKMFGIRCVLKCDGPVPIENAEVAAHLYRITQEAITNAIKHGKAQSVHVELVCREDRNVLTIENDGLDFPEELGTRGTGMGLHIMNHRADMIGASLDIRKAAGDGTIVSCSFRNHGR
jgi:PAS domain S-box-containing protein